MIPVYKKTDSGPLTEGVYYILLSLYRPLHGYGIMQNVKKISNGRVSISAGTLYGALAALSEKGWIAPCKEKTDTRKKEYVITQEGIKRIEEEIKGLEELLKTGKMVTGRITA